MEQHKICFSGEDRGSEVGNPEVD